MCLFAVYINCTSTVHQVFIEVWWPFKIVSDWCRLSEIFQSNLIACCVYSISELDLPLIFFFYFFMSCVCGVCSHLVKRNHRKLTCKLCKKYVHKCCSDLTAKEFRCSESTKYWHCASCNEPLTLPFNHITNECEFQLQLYRCFENGLLNT